MLREYEVQESIGAGVARVLRGEVNAAMLQRGIGTRKGIRFDVVKGHGQKAHAEGLHTAKPPKNVKPGHCAACGDAITEHGKIFA